MANRKNLKKSINYVCGELFAEYIAVCQYKKKTETNDFIDVLNRIADMQTDFIGRVNHTEPGSVKAFYKKLRRDFRTQADEMVDIISNLG